MPDHDTGRRDGTRGGKRDEEAVRRFVEHMAMTLAEWGFPRMPGRVLMAMMTADEALTAGELAERLGVSPAAISGALRYLTQLGWVVREPVAGSRRDRYVLPADAWYEVSMVKGHMFKTLVDLADEGLDALGGPGSPSGERVAEMRAFMQFWKDELGELLERWRATKEERIGRLTP